MDDTENNFQTVEAKDEGFSRDIWHRLIRVTKKQDRTYGKDIGCTDNYTDLITELGVMQAIRKTRIQT